MTEINNRIEEVKKIIESQRSTYEYGNPPVTHGSFTDEDVELSAEQIDKYYCQLFPQPLDDKLSRKAFLALPLEERRRLLSEQLMLMDERDREAIRDLHKLD